MNRPGRLQLNLGVAAISFAALTMELSMIRVMEVILAPNTGYMALTSAMFALGMGGVYLYLFPARHTAPGKYLGRLAILFAIAAPLVVLVFNLLPFGFEIRQENLLLQAACWAGMYLALITPFFAAGLMLSLIFKTYAAQIDRLYFFDLVAAGLACLIFIPLLPDYGPGGMLFVASGAAIVAALCFYRPPRWIAVAFLVAAATMVSVPLTVDDYIEFRGHDNKRDNDALIEQGHRHLVKWDPVSKLDVLWVPSGQSFLFSIDGGTQGSWLNRFNGDYAHHDRVRKRSAGKYFFGRNSIVHYFVDAQGIDPEVLIIGPSAGADVLSALIFGARHVDAVELVAAIIEAERNQFKDFGGGKYNHPKVSAIVGEGRSFLRATDKRYDIIQMYSNHSTSSITQGATAAGVAYLQTIEAYEEYFQHLTGNGVLQINHHVYPRMLTTAAQAWNRSGRNEFWRHALVLERLMADTLPTLLIKMQPWTAAEVDTVLDYVNRRKTVLNHRPPPAYPSDRVFGDKVLETTVPSHGNVIEGIEFLIGTYGRKGLDYDVGVQVFDANGQMLRRESIEGSSIEDNAVVSVDFPAIKDSEDKSYRVVISAPEAKLENSFSVWMSPDRRPSLNFLPGEEVPSNFIAFNPIDPKNNIVDRELLLSPFPYARAAHIPWNITPVSDYSPFFSMIRKTVSPIEAGKDNVIDRNTADLLNGQISEGYPKDWIHLIVVAAVSIIFSLLFIALPLLRTRLRHATWPGMGKDIGYFACLGLGFIMFQVVFIQIFHKLIGFPTHTFVLVISTMLLSAGLGSMVSRRCVELLGGRPRLVFAVIVVYGLIFVLVFEPLFYYLLAFSLPVRLLSGALMIAPLAFFMGMPFPLGILGLSGTNTAAIPWAWALNGFFTVLGGYLAIVVSIMSSFIVVLVLAVTVYGVAMLLVRDPGAVGEREPIAPAQPPLQVM